MRTATLRLLDLDRHPSPGGPVAFSSPVKIRVHAGTPITTVLKLICFLQCGHSQPSTRNTLCNNSAHVSRCSARSERVAPGLVSRFAARSTRCASVDVGTLGRTSPRHAAFPARIAVAGDGLLSPLEAALVAEIRGNGSAVVVALGELKTEIREIRNNPPFRWVPWSMLLLWLLNMFVIAILAMERGVDPLHAAEAVKALSPGITGEPMVGGTP